MNLIKKLLSMSIITILTITPVLAQDLNPPYIDYGNNYDESTDQYYTQNPNYYQQNQYYTQNPNDYQQNQYYTQNPNYYQQNQYYQPNHDRFINDPNVRRKAKTLGKGAVIGAGLGAVYGLVSGKSVGKYALIGTAAGAGTAAINDSSQLRRNPMIKSAALGAALGTAAAFTARKENRNISKGALLGAGVGAGLQWLTDRYNY